MPEGRPANHRTSCALFHGCYFYRGLVWVCKNEGGGMMGGG